MTVALLSLSLFHVVQRVDDFTQRISVAVIDVLVEIFHEELVALQQFAQLLGVSARLQVLVKQELGQVYKDSFSSAGIGVRPDDLLDSSILANLIKESRCGSSNAAVLVIRTSRANGTN